MNIQLEHTAALHQAKNKKTSSIGKFFKAVNDSLYRRK